ncbi:mutator type transposase [Tanacetum coccineum]
MTLTQALTAIQTMADHSQKWHEGTSSRNISSNSDTDGLAAVISKLDNLGRDIKKLKENVHAIQFGCQICEGPHLDKECPLNKEVKQTVGRGQDNQWNSSAGECKVVNNDHETQHRPISSRKLNDKEEWATKDKQCQLLPKELNPGNFTLPCTIGNFNFYGMADLGASVNVMPRNTFEYLRLANLRNTNMLVEMADMTKKAPLCIIESILVRINKFLFLSDFVIIDKTPNETIILGRPFLATIHAEIDVFDNKFSLGVDNARVGHIDISKPMKKALLKLWLIDYFQDESRIVKNPLSRNFYDYKWVFDLEIDQLADEYEFGIRKKDICLIRYGNTVKMSIEIIHIGGMTTDFKKKNVMKWK